MTAESERIKALAGLLTNEDLYDDDLFFSGSVKQKQQVIVEKLSKNAPIKDNGGTLPLSLHHKQQQQQSVIDLVKQPSHNADNNNNNNNNNDGEVKFGGSANQTTFVSSSVRERAAAMSGFLTKKKDGPTSGQARAMEWRGGGNTSTGGNNTIMECTPKKIAPTFVSKFDRVVVGENDANNGGTPSNKKNKGMKKKSKPSFLFQFDDSPRANGAGGNFKEEEGVPRAPLTPRTPRAPLTPRTPSRATNSNSDSNNLLSPRTPRQTTTPRGRHRSTMLPSPRAGAGMNSQTNFEQPPAALNCSMAVEAGSITEEIDDWLGGMSLSDSDDGDDDDDDDDDEHPIDNGYEEDVDYESNGDDEFFMNDLDKVLSEANGFLENVVDSESEEEEEGEEKEEEGVHFGFNDEEESVGMSDELESELESARQLAEGFTRFLVRDEGSMSPVAASSSSSSSSSSREAVENLEEEEEVNCAWAGGEEEEVEEEEYVLSASIEDEVAEEERVEEESVEDNDGDWEGWTRNNDFFANFDDEEDEAEDASRIGESALPREETAPSRVEPDMPRSETKSNKPKLRIQIKGAPEFKSTKEEGDEGVFFYASQPSPLARDDEQLLDTQAIMPSPVSVEPDSSKADTSHKKFDTSPKKFGLKKIVQRACPESDDETVEESSIIEDEVSPFHAHFDMSVSLTRDETEKKPAKTPPKLTIYIKGAPQFTPSQQFEEEDAFYFSQPSPLVGDDKGLLSSNFSSSPSVFEQKKEKTLSSSTKKHLKNFVSKTRQSKGITKFDQDSSKDVFGDHSGPECFNNDFFFAAPASPVRQAKDAMKEGGSTKKKILGMLSGKKKKQNRGLYLLDD